jgi:hypothetical protein
MTATKKKAAKKKVPDPAQELEVEFERSPLEEMGEYESDLPDPCLVVNATRHNIFTDHGKLKPGEFGRCSRRIALNFDSREIVEIIRE